MNSNSGYLSYADTTWQYLEKQCFTTGQSAGMFKCTLRHPFNNQHFRALVAEALELSTFMSGISDLDGELQRLDRGDWAGETLPPGFLQKLTVTVSDVWTQVMGQLRQGIRLKKVDYSRTPAEYELTPYEVCQLIF